jgi:hypothetical protein
MFCGDSPKSHVVKFELLPALLKAFAFATPAIADDDFCLRLEG